MDMGFRFGWIWGLGLDGYGVFVLKCRVWLTGGRNIDEWLADWKN